MCGEALHGGAAKFMAAAPPAGAYGGGSKNHNEPGRGAESTPLLAASGSLPMKRNTSSSVFECAQFHEDREWTGFGPTEKYAPLPQSFHHPSSTG